MSQPAGPSRRAPGPLLKTPNHLWQLDARRMRAWLRDRPQDAFGRHRYDPADFGWTYPALAEEFEEYTRRYLDR